MKIAVIGGTGLIGSQVVKILNASGYEAVAHSPSTGVDLLSGQGLPEARAKVLQEDILKSSRITLAAHGDHRTVVTDNSAGMFAAAGDALIAKVGAVIAKTRYRE